MKLVWAKTGKETWTSECGRYKVWVHGKVREGTEICRDYAASVDDETAWLCTYEPSLAKAKQVCQRHADAQRGLSKPTRSDLLAVVSSLQELVGAAMAASGDRNPDRAAHVSGYLEQAHTLCVEARRFDVPDAGMRSSWNRKPKEPRS